MTVWVDGGGVLVGWVCLDCLRVMRDSAVCIVGVMCGLDWVPSIALEYVELVGFVLYHSLTLFLSMTGCMCCCWRLYVGFDADVGGWR